MPGTRPSVLTEPIASEAAAVLRHDLVTPINLIVGYCDLLMSEAADAGRSVQASPLRAIRGFGFLMLKLIDQVLLSDQPARPLSDLRDLAVALERPVASLVEHCEALEESSRQDEGQADFIDDVQKIRLAGVRLLAMAQSLVEGHLPKTDLPPNLDLG